MGFINIEVKAKTDNAGFIRKYLLVQGAEFRGTDRQVDTYFNVPNGRLKLREGNIENSLIHYNRADLPGLKQSDFRLLEMPESSRLKDILVSSLGVKVVVEKEREIYYIGNVKFHLDHVRELGSFVEIEASNIFGNISLETLRSQCEFYKTVFEIPDKDLIHFSYSDMLMAARNPNGF